MPEQVTITSADVGKLEVPAPIDFHACHRSSVRTEREVFCAHCQAKTKHVMSLDHNKEILATCDKCGRALKFPLPEKPEDLNALLEAHHKGNVGQISAEKTAAERAVYDEQFKKLMGIA